MPALLAIRARSGAGVLGRVSFVVAHSRDRLLSEPIAGTQPCRRQPLFIPKAAAPRLCRNALPLQMTRRFLQTAAVDPQQLFTWPSDRANYVAAAKKSKRHRRMD